ncbi:MULTISPECIES: hypothetical protein [Nocardia]|uniref:hypothetical protein n=1 Tax=Nocardia TaxID=1817 RepID=UPI0024558B03|nr:MULTISPECIES: hypothetical protein [Nocardia]
MNNPGVEPADLLVKARTVMLDALEALAEQRQAVIVIGAQAVYLHTGGLDIALAETTKDSDLALDPGLLEPDPKIEQAMREAGFLPSATGQPGSWVNADGIPVDLMVPAKLAGPGTSRGGRIPPHDNKATRRCHGLEAALVDYREMPVESLDLGDPRVITVKVASPAALIVAKSHKITERLDDLHRLNDKDAHDIYRLFAAVPTEDLREGFLALLADELSREVTSNALDQLAEHFAGSEAIGSVMAGRAEEGVGDPETTAAAVAFLVADLLEALDVISSDRA